MGSNNSLHTSPPSSLNQRRAPVKTRRVIFASLVLCLGLTAGRPRLARSRIDPGQHTELPNPCGYGFRIDIDPEPATKDDPVQVTYSADWPNSCLPWHQSHQIVDNVIRLDALHDYPPDFACLAIVLPWRGKVEVGNLPSGSYNVDVYITFVSTPTVYPPTLCGTRTFIVYEKLKQIYLPIVIRVVEDT